MVIGKRAQQIGKNSPIYVPLSEDEVKRLNVLQIAELEFETGRIPMIIRRYLPDKTFEDWKIKDLKKQTWWNGKLIKIQTKLIKMAKNMICVWKQ